jgi:hypothetical protein
MGNGDLYIYEIRDDKANLIFKTGAVDNHYDSIWNKENNKKYGYSTCGETYQGKKLFANYEDTNQDGITDVILSGIKNIDCEKEPEEYASSDTKMIRVVEIPVTQYFTLVNK